MAMSWGTPWRQIIIRRMWERRWRQTAPRCLTWLTATSGAGLTKSIGRRDTSASLRRRSSYQRDRLRANPVLSLPATLASPAVMPARQSSDGTTQIVIRVTTWCNPKLSCAWSLESIFTPDLSILVRQPSDSHSSDYRLIQMWRKSRGNLPGFAGLLRKYS